MTRKEYRHQYYLKHREQSNAQSRQWYKKNKIKWKIYRHQYYLEHKEHENNRNQQWYFNNTERCAQRDARCRNERPWQYYYNKMRNRCLNPKSSYFKNGIKPLLTVNDFKFLWFRDKGYNLKRPSMDRINTKGNYILENCRFIELSDNLNRPKANSRGQL